MLKSLISRMLGLKRLLTHNRGFGASSQHTSCHTSAAGSTGGSGTARTFHAAGRDPRSAGPAGDEELADEEAPGGGMRSRGIGKSPRGHGLYISTCTCCGVRLRSSAAEGVQRGSTHRNWYPPRPVVQRSHSGSEQRRCGKLTFTPMSVTCSGTSCGTTPRAASQTGTVRRCSTVYNCKASSCSSSVA